MSMYRAATSTILRTHCGRADCFLPELDYVAECEGKLVGNIMYTRAHLLLDAGGEADFVLLFGPVSVLPDFQGRGIGSRLIRETTRLAREMGYRAVLIYGDPDYYSRFGFVPAEQYRIRDAENQYAAALQVLELSPGALDGCAGRFLEDAVYAVDSAAAAAFDCGFQPKEKGTSPTQARFQELSGMRRDAEECRN